MKTFEVEVEFTDSYGKHVKTEVVLVAQTIEKVEFAGKFIEMLHGLTMGRPQPIVTAVRHSVQGEI